MTKERRGSPQRSGRVPGGFERVRILTPLRSRNFALLSAGMTLSLFGEGIFFVAVAWEALRLSNTAVALSLAGVAWMLPTVAFLLIGGTLSDRIDRRRLMLGASLVQALAICAIGTLVTLGQLRLATMLPLVAVYGVAAAFFMPALEAIVPTIVEPENLACASALEELVRQLSLLLAGPAIGGVVIAIGGTGAAFLLDGAMLLAAAGALVAMRVPRHRLPRDDDSAGSFARIAEAIRFARANPWLSRTLIAAALTMLLFVGPSQVLLPFVVKNVLHRGSGTLGAIRACGGVGAMFAALAVSQRGLPGWPIRAMLVGWAVQCITLLGYALLTHAWLFGAIAVIGGAFGAAASVIWGTLMKTRVPNEMLGRVASLDLLVSIALVPVSFAITGPAAEMFGAQITLLGGGVLAGATMLLFAVTAREGAESHQPRQARKPVAATS